MAYNIQRLSDFKIMTDFLGNDFQKFDQSLNTYDEVEFVSVRAAAIPTIGSDLTNKTYVDAAAAGTPTLQNVYDNSANPQTIIVPNGSYMNFKTENDYTILGMSSDVGDIYGMSADVGFIGELDATNITTLTCISGSFTKTGGTNIQYLMANGSTLTSSANSGNSNFYLFLSVAGAGGPPITPGDIEYDNIAQASATTIYMSTTTRDAIDIEVFYLNINTINQIYIQDQANAANFIKYNITGLPSLVSGDYISIPVSVFTSGGTGSTSFGASTQVMMAIFTDTIEVDSRLSALETKTQNMTAVANTTTFTDTVNTTVRSNAPLFDRSDSGALSIGTSANSTSIAIGNDAIATTITGARTNITTRVNAPLHDRSTAGALNIGTSANSTSIAIGNDAIITTITGASTDATTRLNAPLHDVASAGTLSIGTLTANAITIGSGAITTTVNGILSAPTQVYTTALDTSSVVPLIIGGTNQSLLTIGKNATATNINGSAVTIGTNLITPLLKCPDITTNTGTPMSIGTTLQTGLTVGRVGAATTIDGSAITIGSGAIITTITGASTNVSARLNVLGTGTPSSLSNVKINSYDTANNFIQNNIQNLSSGTTASSDWIATNNLGTDTAGFIDMGINSSGFSAGGIGGASDAYLYSVEDTSFNGGNLWLGTPSNKSVYLFSNTSAPTSSNSISVTNAVMTVPNSLLTPLINAPSAVTLSIGTATHTSLNIGYGAVTTTINGLTTTIGTSLVSPIIRTPTLTTNTAVALNIGGTNQTNLTLGRTSGANTLINGVFVLCSSAPYIGTIANPAATNSRLNLVKFTRNLSNVNGFGPTTDLSSSGYGSVNTTASEQVVGTTWRYTISGACNGQIGSTMTVNLVHAGGTQQLFQWAFTTVTSLNPYHVTFTIGFPTVGAAISPIVAGKVQWSDAGIVKIQDIVLSVWSPLYNTTVTNLNTINLVSSLAGGTYSCPIFTVEYLR